MRKLFFCTLIAFTTIYASSSSWGRSHPPDWVLPELNKYPIEIYLFDVGYSDETGEEAFKKATADAEKKIAAKILKEVNHIIRRNKDKAEYTMVLEHYRAVLDSYCISHEESPALQLDKKGFSVRNLSVDLARTDPYTYALVYITREKLADIYADRALNLRRKIGYHLETAKTAEEDLDIKSAVKTYLQTYPLYEKLKEAEIIQIAAQYEHTSDFNNAFDVLANAATYTSEDLWTHRQVIKQVKELEPQIIVSLDDIASVIKSQFLPQYVAFSNKVLIKPLVYEDSEMTCSFTEEFKEALLKEFKWVHDLTSSRRLSSSCWENGDEITIRTTLRDVKTGEFLASAIVQFLNSQLRDSRIYKPSNHEQAQVEKRAFAPRYYEMRRPDGSAETPTPGGLVKHQFPPIGGLNVEVWTDKGSSPLYYTQGETMKVFGRVNQPAYVRLLYILADGKRTLLKDNYYIDLSKVNSDVEIGVFVCTPPFGAEMLVVAARTEEFPSIQTYEKNGYIFLLDQDAESAARSFRGMQPMPESNGNQSPDFQQSDAQLVLTTMEK